MATAAGVFGSYNAWKTNRAVSQGYMPARGTGPSYLPPALSDLTAVYIDQPSYIKADERVTSTTLAKLRLLLAARVALALTTGHVAGYVAQTNVFDYRDKGNACCVGSVAASLELNLGGDEEVMSTSDAAGTINVKGPAIVGEGNKTTLAGIQARIDPDNTVVLV